mgnify:CR=1 FL=1
MREKIDNAVREILHEISKEQDDHFAIHSRFQKVIEEETSFPGLTYSVLNYWNGEQGAGYGVIFTLEENGEIWIKGIDIGFYDPSFLIEGHHPVPHHEWRQK